MSKQPENSKNSIKKAVDAAIEKSKKPTRAAQADSGPEDLFADFQTDDFASRNGLPYAVKLRKIERKTAQGTEVSYEPKLEPYTYYFDCRIVRQIVSDDGISEQNAFEIVGRDIKGRRLPTLTVPAHKFAAMNWPIEGWGVIAALRPGQGTKDGFRAYVMTARNDRIESVTTYGHSGWRKINGQWVFLTASGAITADGLDESVTVSLDQGRLNLISLPAPPRERAHQVAGAARLLSILELSTANPARGYALLGCALRAVLCECAPVEFSLMLHGRTGSHKSESACIAQALFGAGFADKNFAASFAQDTAGALGRKLFMAKDVFLILEDCKATTERGARELQDKGESILHHGVGNRTGRDRLGKDSRSGGPCYSSRTLAGLTGETLLTGESLRARTLIVIVRRDEVDLGRLTQLQREAREGLLAEAMSAYIAWLAPQIDDLRVRFPKRLREIRDEVKNDPSFQAHPRSPDIYANLLAAFELFARYLVDIGAETEEGGRELLNRFSNVCGALLREQVDHIQEQDEVRRFFSLLHGVLSGGNGYIADHIKQGAPALHPSAWGWAVEKIWLEDTATGQHNEVERLKPKGDRLGWLHETTGHLYLEKEGCFARVSDLARRQGEPLIIKSSELWRQLQERGLLAEWDKGGPGARPRTDTRKSIGGVMHRVVVLKSGLVNPSVSGTGTEGPKADDAQEDSNA